MRGPVYERSVSLRGKDSTLIGRIVLPVLLFLSISKGVLADEQTSKRPDWYQRLEMLRSVPYISHSEGLVDANEAGVVLYDPEKSYAGYNFYCTNHSGKAFLLDMMGQEVHRWEYSSRGGIIDDHALLLENGDLMVIKVGDLLRLNWDSDLIWRKKLLAHHDVVQAPDGSFYAIVKERWIYRDKQVWFDALVHISAKGEELDRWSSYKNLAQLKGVLDTRSFLDTILDSTRGGSSPESKISASPRKGRVHRDLEYFHMNTVNIIPDNDLGEKDQRFQQGNLLVCFRNVNQIVVLEKDTYRVLWAWGESNLEEPHHPTMPPNGHILIFDNGTQRRYSRVVELDPLAEDIVWEYTADPPDDFYSCRKGAAQRLPNGNTLISESDQGRVFEVTHEGELVWEWLNPVIVAGHRQAYYRMLRLPAAFVDGLLEVHKD
jgi:hypothetical protein